jgi:hypothetical protein
MSEDEHVRAENEEAKDEVEAHGHKPYANEEPKAEGESDDDVEAHAGHKVQSHKKF